MNRFVYIHNVTVVERIYPPKKEYGDQYFDENENFKADVDDDTITIDKNSLLRDKFQTRSIAHEKLKNIEGKVFTAVIVLPVLPAKSNIYPRIRKQKNRTWRIVWKYE